MQLTKLLHYIICVALTRRDTHLNPLPLTDDRRFALATVGNFNTLPKLATMFVYKQCILLMQILEKKFKP